MKESRYNIWLERANTFYIFCGLSGELLSLSRDEAAILREYLNGQTEGIPSFVLPLVTARALILDSEDELDTLKTLYQRSRFDTSQFYLRIITSLGCNFNCPYCFESKHPSIIDVEVQDCILAVVEDRLPTTKRFKVSWFGGEPLVGKKSLLFLSDKFIKLCEKFNVNYDARIYTNGYLLDENTCAQLRSRRVTSMQITLDGPPSIHDNMRPLANGSGSFWTIIKNLKHAVNYFSVEINVNLDANNICGVEDLFKILANEGLAGKVAAYAAQLFGADSGVSSPSATYSSTYLTKAQFANAEIEFKALARQYGLLKEELPKPQGTPCTAVRANELIVGSNGELYKCPINIGNEREVIGNIRDYKNTNERLHRWLKYDPFSDPECRACIALPGCMGGCAHHAMSQKLYDNRCVTFRQTYREQISAFIEGCAEPSLVKITRH